MNTLQLDTSGGTGILDLGGASNILTLTQFGILVTGANSFTIQDGEVGAAATEVIVHQFATGTLTIAGTISSGAGSLTNDRAH